jgi:Ca-activated chloride channel family protein
MIQFAWIWIFVLLPLPWLMRFLPPVRHTSDAALQAPFFQEVLTLNLQSQQRARRYNNAGVIFWLLWLLLLVAAARPQWLGDPVAVPVAGRDLMMAVDLSGSMEAADLELNGQPATRLDVVKSVAGDFIDRRVGDRVGLILFGKRAYVQTPLTFDRATVHTMLRDAEIGLAGKETAIGDAIGLAIKRLREQPQEKRILILLTDGANTAGEVDPDQAANLAAKEKVTIYTIGVGADAMALRNILGSQGVNPLSLLGAQLINPSRDLDEKTLKYIAQTTGGKYFRAKDTESLEEIYRILDKLEPTEKDAETYRPVKELYIWPLGVAFVLTLLYALWWLLPVSTVLAGASAKLPRKPKSSPKSSPKPSQSGVAS